MNKFLLYLGLTVSLTACSLFENKEKKAIEICQKAKVELQTNNAFANLFLGASGLGSDATWLDFANMIAKQDPNKKYEWKAKITDTTDIYIVSFVDENNWGHNWQVNIEQQTVIDINQNDYLSRKYGFSRFDQDGNFEITNIITDTLKVEKHYSDYSESNSKEVVYVLKASVINKTGKTLTDAKISGKLQVIFKDKTVEGTSDDWEGGFKTEVTESRPWNPDTQKDFFIKTKGIEEIYLSYEPEYVFFEVGLKAEDPVGFSYDKNIEEYDLKNQWIALKP